MKTIETHIEFSSGSFKLNGMLHLPSLVRPPVVIGSHGLEGSKESAKQKILSKILPDHGIAFLRFDHRGCGQSQGDFLTQTTLEKRSQDFLSAVDAVMALGQTSRHIGIFGSSLGGSTCIQAYETLLKMDIRLCGTVLCSAPIKSRTIENIPIDPTDQRGALPLSFFKDNLVFDLLEQTKRLENILIFHGDKDEVVPVQNAHEMYAHAKDPKKIIIQRDGNHQMTSTKDQAAFESNVVKWFTTCFRSCQST